MTQKVRVTAINADGSARVIHVRQSACSGDCHKCSGCGAAQETLLLTAANPIGAKAGDLVTIASDTRPVLTGAAVAYLLPLLLFFLGYLAGQLLWQKGALAGGLAFAVAVVATVVYDRKVASKKKKIYTIIGFAD